MTAERVFDLTGRREPPSGIGGKALGLHRLARAGFSVPQTYVVPWDAPADDTFARELAQRLDDDATYAVRSSADVEDSAEASYAGQFESVLDVPSAGVRSAVDTVREQVASERVRAYRERTGQTGELHMGVVVQRMVPARFAGVAFSRDPMTGLHEVVIEAVQGGGSALVQDGITPERFVWKWGAWKTRPDTPALPEEVARLVAAEMPKIEDAFSAPVDAEWAWDGERVWWIQARPITALSGQAIYSNRISREFLPGVILPLVWSVNIPLVNGAWIELLERVAGPLDVAPADLARQFHYRAYFNMTALGTVFESVGLPAEALELMIGIESDGPDRPGFRPQMRVLKLSPRIVGFLLSLRRLDARVQRDLPDHERQIGELQREAYGDDLDASRALELIDRLMIVAGKVAYLNILVPLLALFVNRVFRRRLERVDVAYEDFDFGREERAATFDPTSGLAPVAKEWALLEPQLRDHILDQGVAAVREEAAAAAFFSALDRFIERYGHFSASGNDFAAVPWREDPDQAVAFLVGGQRDTATRGRVTFDVLERDGRASGRLRRAYERAARYRDEREYVSSVYTLGYGLFRPLYLSVGRDLVRRGLLGEASDVFYLEDAEVRALHAGMLDASGARAFVAERRTDVERVRDLPVPDTIFGDAPAPLVTTSGERLTGLAVSRGQYVGRVRKVSGPRDFGSVSTCEVLVVPYSDVGWTPLFARAGAVVAEAGGFLSHSAIVAREYGIPAVVSVGGAMGLNDDELVRVDGYAGTVERVAEEEN